MQRSICLDVCDYTDTPLCNLYDSTNDLSGQATNVVVHTERNGFKEIHFNIPSVLQDGEKNYRLDYLITDYKLRLITNFNSNKKEVDWFFISEPKITHNQFSKNYEVRASHVSTLLNTKNLSLEFSDDEGNNTGTIEQIAETILEGTGWHLGKVSKFYEEDKYVQYGVKKEKIRSFTASAKTGAFRMMSDLCELFDAKPIYHGAGTYEEDGEEKIGRTVDIIPLNPFSKDITEGEIPQEVKDGIGVLELHYDKNVSSITRTANSDNLVTVFSAYGSYGDENGMVSLQTCEHAEITFGHLEPGTYCFEYLETRYFFTLDRDVNMLKWSYLDPMSRSYIFNGEDLFEVTTNPPAAYETITGSLEMVKNQVSFLMDFSYYKKIGLLTDEMIFEIAKFQNDLPTQYVIVQESSLGLSSALKDLSATASAGGGFCMLDIAGTELSDGYVKIHLNKSEYEDGVIFRSDYDEAKRNYFTWDTATSIKSSGESIDGRGAVIYIVHQGNPTKWEKAYVQAYGNAEDNYYRDSLDNVYELHTKLHYDRKDYEASYPSDTYFPHTGHEGIIYVADNTKKMYVWFNESYTEIQTSGYNYGLKEFNHPDYITLWSTKDTWHVGDKVYMFSSDSIAGMYGPREDQVNSNRKSIEEALKNGTTEVYPIVFLNETDIAPDANICSTGYGWYYRTYENTFRFGDLYFCYGKNGELGWSRVYVSNEAIDPEAIQPVSGYTYFYSLRTRLAYRQSGDKYIPLNKNTDEEHITSAFSAVIEGCYKQEILSKGVLQRYNYNDTFTELKGNYAFKNEFNNYYLFSTGTRTVTDPSLVYYDSSTRMVWLDKDEEHIVNSSEYSFRYLDFPKANEIPGVSFALMDDVQTSSNITVHDNTEYEFYLPPGSKIVCYDDSNHEIDNFTSSPFVTPNHTAHVKILSSTVPTSNHFFRVVNFDIKLFVKDVGYTLLNSVGAGERYGLSYLMDRFISLAHNAYEVRLPALQAAQKTISDRLKSMSEYLGDMYREGFWQEPSYVEGDEDKLYADALENFKEISHPQYTYEVTFLDLYGSDDNLDATVKTEYPDVDITYAAHLIDPDIETNKWAYIDSIDKCYDKPWETQLEINTQLSLIGQQSFTDVLGKIAEVANEVKAKQTIYERAGSINTAGQIAANKLEGLIEANKVYLLGGTSNWYTDTKGNITFEAADGQSAMMLTGRGLMVSNSTDQYGDWLWRTAISGLGINADTIAAGEFSAKHIIAGSITVDKLAANVGQELEIGTNKTLTLYATVDGSRPAGAVLTKHKAQEGDSWIQIGAKTGSNPAFIDVQSGGEVHLYGGSSMSIASGGDLTLTGATINIMSQQEDQNKGKINIEAGSSFNIKSNGIFTVNTENFKILENENVSGQYDVTVKGNITTTGGKIAGYTIGQTTSGQTVIDYMYAGQTVSLDTNSAGVYLGTNGFNLGGKFVYKLSDESLNVKATSLLIGDTASSYLQFNNGSVTMNASASLTLNANSSITINSSKTLTLTTNGIIQIGNTGNTFKIGTNTINNAKHAYIQTGSRTSYDHTGSDGVYIGTDGISLGRTGSGTQASPYVIPFKVSSDGALTAINATISGNITAGSFNNGNSTFVVTSAGAVTAKSGTVGGWTLSDTSLTSNKTGMSKTTNDNDIAFWAGSNTASSANFQVTQAGKATCKNIDVTGGSITLKDSSNNTVFSASSSGAEIKGTLRATSLYVGSNNIISNNKIEFNTTNFNLNVSNNALEITNTGIKVKSGGTLDLSAAGTINLSYTKLSDKPDVFTVPSGVTIAEKHVKVYSGNNYVDITDSGITANGTFVKAQSGSNYVNINSSGITMNGTSLTINGRTFNDVNLFARDDIVILKSTDDEGTVIQQHSSQHDWVLIKPYYNAEVPISFSGQYQYTTSPAAVAIKTVSEAESFLDGGRYWYKASLYYYTSEGNSRTFTLYLSNNTSFNPQVAITVDAGYAGSGGHYIDIPLTESAVNVCGANKTIYAKFYCNKAVTLNGGTNTITCYTNKTTSQVKCAVYYFP